MNPNRRSREAAAKTGMGGEPRRPRVLRLPRAATVVFDCDSTLCGIEGIEVLAREHRAEIERLTAAAMEGDVPLEVVYGRRLALVRPGRTRIEALGRRYIETLVPDARAVVAALQAEAIVVRVVSGGLLPAVLPLAAALGIGADDVAAVDVHFDAAGEYTGYDTNSPLARAGGKAEVMVRWRRAGPIPMLLVGDGATDLEARDAVEVFVAFAGVVERAAVTAAADVVVRASSLAPILPLALGGRPPAGAVGRALYERGLALLDDAARATLDHSSTMMER